MGVVPVPETISEPAQQSRSLQLSLNSDGRRHPLLNAVTGFVFLAGIAAFALSIIVREHLVATILGIVAFGVGLTGQLYSATREERILLVTGIVGGFVGMGLGIAHGGFS
jgi:hypothetical protein